MGQPLIPALVALMMSCMIAGFTKFIVDTMKKKITMSFWTMAAWTVMSGVATYSIARGSGLGSQGVLLAGGFTIGNLLSVFALYANGRRQCTRTEILILLAGIGCWGSIFIPNTPPGLTVLLSGIALFLTGIPNFKGMSGVKGKAKKSLTLTVVLFFGVSFFSVCTLIAMHEKSRSQYYFPLCCMAYWIFAFALVRELSPKLCKFFNPSYAGTMILVLLASGLPIASSAQKIGLYAETANPFFKGSASPELLFEGDIHVSKWIGVGMFAHTAFTTDFKSVVFSQQMATLAVYSAKDSVFSKLTMNVGGEQYKNSHEISTQLRFRVSEFVAMKSGLTKFSCFSAIEYGKASGYFWIVIPEFRKKNISIDLRAHSVEGFSIDIGYYAHNCKFWAGPRLLLGSDRIGGIIAVSYNQ